MIKIGPCDYNAGAPEGYVCGDCEARGVKLWRDPDPFVALPRLRCAWCARRHQHLGPGKIPENDRIGSLWPAIPTAEGSSFWHHYSTPIAGLLWWKRLPERET